MKKAIFGLKKKIWFLDWNYTFFHVSGHSVPPDPPKVTTEDDHSSLHKIEIISPRKSGRKRKKIINENSADDDPILDVDFVPPVDDDEEEEKKILVEEKPKKRGK